MPNPVHKIPIAVTYVDANGKRTTEGISWSVMPAAPGRCQVCAAKHDEGEPHDRESLFYQMKFEGMIGRAPTWADAMAHCTESVRAVWREGCVELGYWSEPPNGEPPVAHLGTEDGA